MVGTGGEVAQARARLERARLYCITPERPAAALELFARQVLAGGIDVLQLRAKSLARGELLGLARRLAAECARSGALFVVNDQVDIALLSGADGVHLGPDDIPVAAARAIAGERLLIGASAGTPETAQEAAAAGADYIGCGPFAATANKPGKQAIGADAIARVSDAVDIPVFAIGGIGPGDIAALRERGLSRVCVISALADAADPGAAAHALREQLS